MSIFSIVCPSIKAYTSFSSDKYISDRRFFYKKYIEKLSELGFTIEYLAEDQVAKYVLNDLGISNTVCITALPKIDEDCFNRYFSKQVDILPEDYSSRFSSRVEFKEEIKVKYPRVTDFKSKDEYLSVRRTSLIESIRLHANVYKGNCRRLIDFRSTSNFSSNIHESASSQGDGRLSILVDMKDNFVMCSYGGVRVDLSTMEEILKVEALADGK